MRMVVALALGLGALALVGCHNCDPVLCAPQADDIFFGVTTSPEMLVNGVQATLTGPVTVTMSCGYSIESRTVCRWPPEVVVTAGTYALQVSAPGYQMTIVQSEVTLNPGECGCTRSSFQPSTVALSSADAGTD